ncbi:major histocompatibility complex class I-related gene protein-like [Misgurnus anguillicaudatus]|uniref:major histocompatibility complex class I-related gene protein-like n=1 Tax=Misgurnus anguillicaudatus TaxID=75329 RepID=UPI003CCF82EE
MYILVYLFLCVRAIKAGSHSLLVLATYVIGQTPFPEFAVVVKLDDVLLGYYDSNTWKIIYRSHTDAKYHDEDQQDADRVFDDICRSIKGRALYLKEHINQTRGEGIYVHQKLVDCELLHNDKPGKIHSLDAFNGLDEEDLTYDVELKKIHTKLKWVLGWDKFQSLSLQFRFENKYQPICFKVLRRYLHMENSYVMRKVKPTVRLFKKTLIDSGRTRITCLATGFYPRHINLTILSNGKEADEQIIGNLLPNGDETYQIRKSLEISAEELHKEQNYSCKINHISLDNDLHITLDLDESDVRSVVIIVLMSLAVVAVLIITLFIVRKKRLFKAPQQDVS